jgi:hypothetical protein
MAYEEYDYYNEPAGEGKSVKESLREILNGLQDRTKLRETGISLKEALQLTPNVTESLGRGGVAQAIGTSGDLRDLSNTINSYLPKSVRNFTRAAEFLANPYATAIQQTAPTTEETLDFVPRATAPYQGYKQHETLGEFVAPSLGYFGGKAFKAMKDMPIGMSIEDVTKKLPTLSEYEAMVDKGQMRQARTFEQDLKDTLSGKVPGNVFEIPMTHNVDYESGYFTKRLEDAGLQVYDDKYGTVYVGKTPKDLEIIKNAETPIEHGTSYGYTPEDIAKFYTNRRGGRSDIGYAEYLDDLKRVQSKYPIDQTVQDVNQAIPAASVEVKSIPQSEIDELGFHSPLENAILKIGQPKGTGDQFLKQLEKTPGVKTEELDVSGVKQYLLDHPNVTKQELLDYMGQNRLKLEQKVLGESTGEGNTYEDYQLRGGDVYHDDDYIQGLADDLHYDMKNDDVIRSQEREALLEADPERYADYETNPYSQARLEEDIDGVLYENAKQQANDMYYENPISHYYDDHGYEIYGNDEMGYSFKDPNGRFLDIGGRNGTYDLSDAESNLRSHLLDEGILSLDDEGAAKFEDYTLPGKYTNYREVLTTLPNKSNANYQSGHFDEPNILAHTRLNDRIINGKKTLMVEEIQSDWHQAGRRKGYASEAAPLKQEYDSKLEDWRNYLKEEAAKYGGKPENFNKVSEEALDRYATQDLYSKLDQAGIDRMNEIFAAKNQAWQNYKAKLSTNVPDAPFKKNWHELMMKQILNEAVKGDYDAIAFTTGKQQNERYNLAKFLDEVYYKKNDDGTYTVSAIDKNHRSHMGDSYTPEQIEEHLGKDMAKKIVDDTGKTIERSDSKSISGEGLSIGGEGMKGFYDKILPDFVNKYTKKWGMGVRKANTLPSLQGEQVHMVDLTDAAKKDIKSKGQPLFSGIGLAAPPLLMDNEEDN